MCYMLVFIHFRVVFFHFCFYNEKFWNTLEYFGILWNTLEYFGIWKIPKKHVSHTKVFQSMPWDPPDIPVLWCSKKLPLHSSAVKRACFPAASTPKLHYS